jgi:nicotinate-nucleotide adenylyltransferase
MSRVALLGGSFNPPHVAHQMAALWVLSTGRADQVWLVPCFQHPFAKKLCAFEHRRRMCELAVEGLWASGLIAVSSVEQELGGTSRTLDTIEHLLGRHPGHELALVIGADILGETDSWYRFEEIERLVDLIVVGRGGYEGPEGTVVLPRVSSTEIRARLRAGEPVDHLVPARVLAYIEEQGLYRGA